MRLVVDTNVVFSALIAGGKTREAILTRDLELAVPEFVYTGLKHNESTVQAKTGPPTGSSISSSRSSSRNY